MSTEGITGEAVPVRKGLGDELPSGARVEDGALVVRATRPASESTIARIAQLSRQAKVHLQASGHTGLGSGSRVSFQRLRPVQTLSRQQGLLLADS